MLKCVCVYETRRYVFRNHARWLANMNISNAKFFVEQETSECVLMLMLMLDWYVRNVERVVCLCYFCVDSILMLQRFSYARRCSFQLIPIGAIDYAAFRFVYAFNERFKQQWPNENSISFMCKYTNFKLM